MNIQKFFARGFFFAVFAAFNLAFAPIIHANGNNFTHSSNRRSYQRDRGHKFNISKQTPNDSPSGKMIKKKIKELKNENNKTPLNEQLSFIFSAISTYNQGHKNLFFADHPGATNELLNHLGKLNLGLSTQGFMNAQNGSSSCPSDVENKSQCPRIDPHLANKLFTLYQKLQKGGNMNEEDTELLEMTKRNLPSWQETYRNLVQAGDPTVLGCLINLAIWLCFVYLTFWLVLSIIEWVGGSSGVVGIAVPWTPKHNGFRN